MHHFENKEEAHKFIHERNMAVSELIRQKLIDYKNAAESDKRSDYFDHLVKQWDKRVESFMHDGICLTLPTPICKCLWGEFAYSVANTNRYHLLDGSSWAVGVSQVFLPEEYRDTDTWDLAQEIEKQRFTIEYCASTAEEQKAHTKSNEEFLAKALSHKPKSKDHLKHLFEEAELNGV